MRSSLIAGNWKMNGSLASVIELVEGIKAGNAGSAELAVCPPSIYLMKVGGMLDGTDIALGSQNVCDQEKGAFTGFLPRCCLKAVVVTPSSGIRNGARSTWSPISWSPRVLLWR
jgi:triosephosphate isomerase